MRFAGILTSWNDERGFGFIQPVAGGQEIFVHIKAFKARAERPQIGQKFTFQVDLNPEGKKRATRVQPLRPASATRRSRNDSPAQWGTASFFAIPAFLFLYLLVAIIWRVPHWVGGLYLAASSLCFIAYSFDKSAAGSGRWRVPEGNLLALGLIGGWPGALVAQQLLRHKSIKASFRSKFWRSVTGNVVAFGVLNSPLISLLPV